MSIFQYILEPQVIVNTVGIIGITAIIFLETGAFFGFFFPGDSLLFTAGFMASYGIVSLPLLLVFTFVAAVVGDSLGYAFGKKIGPAIFTKDNSAFFNKKHILRAQDFYKKYGPKTIVLARFVPIVRTFAPIVAGVGNMEYRKFISFNLIGGFFWTWLMVWLGFGFGSVIPNPDKYILPIVAVIIIVSVLPALIEIVKRRR